MISYSQFLKSNKKFFSTLISLKSIIGNCSSLSEMKIKIEIMRMIIDVNTIKVLFDITFGIEEQCALSDFLNLMNRFRCDTNLAQFLTLTSSEPICNKVNQNALKILLKMLDDRTYDCFVHIWRFLDIHHE